MSKVHVVSAESRELLYTFDTSRFNDINRFFKNLKTLNLKVELNGLHKTNWLLHQEYRLENNNLIFYHGDSNTNKNYNNEKEGSAHLKIVNNKTGVIDFFVPVPTYSKYHINEAIETFLRDNKDYKIVHCKTTGKKQFQKSYNPDPILNYNQFLTLGYGCGLVVNALQQITPSPSSRPQSSRPPPLSSRPPSSRPQPPPSSRPQPPPSSRPQPPPSSRPPPPPSSRPQPPPSSRPPPPPSSRPPPPPPPSSRPPLPTNYFSNNRESSEITTESLLVLNSLNRVKEFESNTFQNNTSLLVLNLLNGVKEFESKTVQNNTPQFKLNKLNKSSCLNLQSNSKLRSYSETFLTEFFNPTKNNSLPPPSPCESPHPHPFGPPPPYISKAEFS